MARKAALTDKKTTKPKTAARKPAPRRCSVTFKFHAPHAGSVDVAGTFNSWQLRALKKGKDGMWKTNIRPLPGRYEYKFLVDHQWMPDPENTNRVQDEYGNENSVLELD